MAPADDLAPAPPNQFLYIQSDSESESSLDEHPASPLYPQGEIQNNGPNPTIIASQPPPDATPPPDHGPHRVVPPVMGTTAPPRFPIYPKRGRPVDVYESAHPRWFVRLYMVVIAFIHFSFHLPFVACNILLFTFATILRAVGALSKDEEAPITLGTVLKRLGIEDRFATVPLCPTCHKLFIDPVDDPATFTCPECDTPIFQSSPNYFPDIFTNNLSWMRPKKSKPRKVVPFRSVSSLLSEFLETEGMVDKMDAWRTKDRTGDRLQDIMDGRIWGELKDTSGQEFFRPGVEDELRIGVTVNLDWYGFLSCSHPESLRLWITY